MAMKRAAKPSCEVVSKQHRLFESTDIIGFLVGMKEGQKCVGESIRLMCKGRVMVSDMERMMERGLPTGAARATALTQAVAKLSSKDPNDLCAMEIVNKLKK